MDVASTRAEQRMSGAALWRPQLKPRGRERAMRYAATPGATMKWGRAKKLVSNSQRLGASLGNQYAGTLVLSDTHTASENGPRKSWHSSQRAGLATRRSMEPQLIRFANQSTKRPSDRRFRRRHPATEQAALLPITHRFGAAVTWLPETECFRGGAIGGQICCQAAIGVAHRRQPREAPALRYRHPASPHLP